MRRYQLSRTTRESSRRRLVSTPCTSFYSSPPSPISPPSFLSLLIIIYVFIITRDPASTGLHNDVPEEDGSTANAIYSAVLQILEARSSNTRSLLYCHRCGDAILGLFVSPLFCLLFFSFSFLFIYFLFLSCI